MAKIILYFIYYQHADSGTYYYNSMLRYAAIYRYHIKRCHQGVAC